MTQRWMLVLSAALAACGGKGSPVPIAPSGTPEQSVRGFLQAVTDSNIAGMAGLWGTAKGPAVKTGQPPDYERRLIVTQLFLRGAKYRIIRNDPVEGAPDRRSVLVELDRTRCVRNVPFVMTKTEAGGWVVTQIDLNLAGTPARPCAPDERTTP